MSAPCDVCGAPLAAGAKRCAVCGAPPAPAARVLPRRPVLDAVPELTAQTVAPVGLRVLAFTVDVVVLGLAVGLGYVLAGASGGLHEPDGSWSPAAVALPGLLVVAAATQWLVEARSGATVGNALTGIRTMASQTYRPAGMSAIAVRVLVELAGALVALVGAWVVVASGVWGSPPARRGWHDTAARTLVLRARSLREAGVEGPGTSPAVHRALGPVPVLGMVRPVPGVVPNPRDAPPRNAPIISTTPGLVRPAPWKSITVSTSVQHVEVITGPPGPRPGKLTGPASPADRRLIDVPNRLVSGPPRPTVRGPVIGAPPTEAISIRATSLRRVPVLPRIGARSRHRPDGLVEPEVRPADPGLPELEHARLRPDEPPARVTEQGLVLRFDSGLQLEVEGDGLVGRAPDDEPGLVHLVAIDDPGGSISRVHLAFGVDRRGNRLWFVDRGSMNGTVVVRPDGTEVSLAPGKRTRVDAGSTVRFGQRTIEVRSRSELDWPAPTDAVD
ncbi:RDD family protein [Cellulomonas sp. URHE0023]|uniref:RDD family protein n=1 Tax=Cellulomonas sp. URHE0023 TaxID=1380354 RepID=UPI0012DF1E33|nr:RDD family protein [Cellulomonas sp. URHE0023]